MSSLEDLAALRTAIELCNNSELKKEILCTSGPEYERRKTQWNQIVENKAEIIVEKLDLIQQLRKKTAGLAILIGLRMLIWAKYHERTLGLTREFSIKFLNSSYFTSQGIIGNKKAAEELMKDESLGIKQKYKLACLYCLTQHIPDLYRQMSQEDKEELYDDQRIKQPEIVTFWSYYLRGQIDELRGEKTVDRYRLETAINSGSKAAVEYCLEKTLLSRKKDAVADAALETVRKMTGLRNWDYSVISECQQCMGSYWIPNDHFVDVLCFLLSKMREDQLIEFLKKDIEDANSAISVHEKPKHSRVLQYLLNWPYHNCFLKTAELMWDFLPEWSYADLLIKICDKMNPSDIDLRCGEQRNCDYWKIFKEFWRRSPDRYKRNVFCDEMYCSRTGLQEIIGSILLVKVYRIKDLSFEDLRFIELILDSATDQEKKRIISSRDGTDICMWLMSDEKWKTLEGFISKCLPTKEEAEKFKRELIFTKRARYVCIEFITRDNWDAAEAFIKFGSLCEEEIMLLKRSMSYGENGSRVCLKTVEYLHGTKRVEKFLMWCLPSEEVRAFKKGIFNSQEICDLVARRVVWGELELVNEIFNWGNYSEEEIGKLKKHVAYTAGSRVCEQLISHDRVEKVAYDLSNYILRPVSKYLERKWERVGELLTWCFSSEEEISHFKRDCLLRVSGKAIHFNLMKFRRGEAETFFAWLELSPEEVKELKRETLFNHEEAHRFLHLSMSKSYGHFRIDEPKHEDITMVLMLLRWCLADKEAVLEFRDHFKQRYERENITEEDRIVLEEFDSAIEQRLSDLEEEQRHERKMRT